jgi:lysophosphatidate acyltransferase
MKNCVCIAKNSLFWVLPFGPAAKLVGTVFIDRSHTSAARSTLIQLGKEMITEGKKVFIFPEGTRNSGEELLPFKKGAFHIAKLVKVPILPIVFGPYDFLNSKTMWFGSGKKLHIS